MKSQLAKIVSLLYSLYADQCYPDVDWTYVYPFLEPWQLARTECFDDHIQAFFYKAQGCKDEDKFTPIIPDTYDGPAIL